MKYYSEYSSSNNSALQAIGECIHEFSNSSVKLNEDQKRVFKSEYESRNKNKKLLVVVAVLMPVQLLILGKTGLGVAIRLTMGGDEV